MFLFLVDVRCPTPPHVEIVTLCVRLYIYRWSDSGSIAGDLINPTNFYTMIDSNGYDTIPST